jgi:DNA-binding MarR family transcriptional regulator
MDPTKADKLSSIVLTVFQLNGLLIEWGNDFCLPHGLTSARWQVLGAIAIAPQAPSAPQIGMSMGITRQGVQKQINLLIEEGLVQAHPNPEHKRSPLYVLTKQGQNTYQVMSERWEHHVQKLSSQFRATDLEATIRVLFELSSVYAALPGHDSAE